MRDSKLTPFEESLLNDAKRKERNAQAEVNRRDAMPNAQREHYQAQQELKTLLAQLRHNGRNV
jgi:hypothetical protein